MKVAGEALGLLALAEHAARRAGAELLRRFGHASGVETKSSATDPVSDADRAAEDLLVQAIRAARPRDGILGEEGAARSGTSGLRWVVDPLDGTVNYLYGLAEWSVSVAVEDAEGVLLGVVHAPVHGETFTAVRGAGAWLDGRPLRVNEPQAASRALIATGFAYDPDHRRRQAQTIARLLPEVRDIRRMGSAALDLCAVAAGRVDGYYEDSTSRWDWAAGARIAEEAGAVVRILAGPAGSEGVLVAAPALHGALAGLLELPEA